MESETMEDKNRGLRNIAIAVIIVLSTVIMFTLAHMDSVRHTRQADERRLIIEDIKFNLSQCECECKCEDNEDHTDKR